MARVVACAGIGQEKIAQEAASSAGVELVYFAETPDDAYVYLAANEVDGMVSPGRAGAGQADRCPSSGSRRATAEPSSARSRRPSEIGSLACASSRWNRACCSAKGARRRWRTRTPKSPG